MQTSNAFRRHAVVIGIALLAYGPSFDAAAQTTSSGTSTARPASGWEFSVLPYAFLTGVSGSTTLAEIATWPINATFSDLVQNLRLGGMLRFGARKGPWGVGVDVEYMSLEGETTGRIPMALRLDNTFVEVVGQYMPGTQRGLTFVVGARVYEIRQEIEFNDMPTEVGSITVVDPIFGAIGTWQLSESWGVTVHGNFGGFSTGSELTHELFLGADWRFSRLASLNFGYRLLGYRVDKDPIRMDVDFTGLVLGVAFRF